MTISGPSPSNDSNNPTLHPVRDLTQNVIRARQQLRKNGRFAVNDQRRGSSSSTIRRMRLHSKQGSEIDREKLLKDVLMVLFVPGESADYIPASVSNGAFVSFIRTILAPCAHIPKRNAYTIAKKEYLRNRRLKSLPRRNIKRGGIVVKRMTMVFAGMRLPDPSSPHEISSVRRLLNKLHQKSWLAFENVTSAMDAGCEILGRYNRERKEYSDFPSESLAGAHSPFPSDTREGSMRGEFERSSATTTASNNIDPDDDAFISLIDASARSDQDFLALKMLLLPSRSSMTFSPSVCRVWANMESVARPLTRFEKLLFDFTVEQDSAKKSILRKDLELLLVGFIKLRRGYGLDLFLLQGYHPEDGLLPSQ